MFYLAALDISQSVFATESIEHVHGFFLQSTGFNKRKTKQSNESHNVFSSYLACIVTFCTGDKLVVPVVPVKDPLGLWISL